MDKKPNEIVRHIESQRAQLGQNLTELEDRVHDAADWRVQYSRHPFWFVGAAAGAGLFAGLMAGTQRTGSVNGNGYAATSQKNVIWDSIDQIKGALVDFGAAKVKDALNDIFHGLDKHLRG
jgi:hypothetical protein